MVTELKKRKILTSVLCIAVAAVFSLFTLTTVLAYSSDSDPLVSLSYLNDVVLPMLREEFSGNNTVKNDDKEVTENVSKDITDANQTAANIGTYELLELTSGQTVLCESATEIIVRPGSLVTVVSPFEAQGIADITNGNELLDGQEIPINAYCIIPRGKDGRGFYVLSENAYIMIRGEYTIG